MAAGTCCFFPACISVQKSGPALKPLSRVSRLKHCQVTVEIKSSTLKIRSSLREEVFVDHSNGIICYKDDRGEIICEGFDEGPRYHQQNPKTACQPREAEIFDLLQQRWLNFMTDAESLNLADKGSVVLQEDIKNCNGFNSLR